MIKNETTKNKIKAKKEGISLDKLAQLHKGAPANSLEGLKKRARAKYFTNSYTIPLAQLKSNLQRSYNNTIYGCSNELTQSGQKVTGRYCNNRWCVVCNRIRTAKLINGYMPGLNNLNNKYFVTLTIPNCNNDELRDTIKKMIKTFQDIKQIFSSRKIKFIGIRKLECTFNETSNNYHPHFHLIVDGLEQSEKLVQEWLKRFGNSKRIAQDIRPANNESVMELFKYFTKIVTKKQIHISALDNIFQAMRNLRVYQAFGLKMNVSEDIDEIETQIIEDLKECEKVWTWIESDWIDMETGECLTSYTPTDEVKELYKNMIKR